MTQPDPHRVAKSEEAFQGCLGMFDYYVGAVETDMNRYFDEKHVVMQPALAHHDLTRLLSRDVNAGALAGMVAAAILREIERKTSGGKR